MQRHARQSRRTTSECWERCKTSVAEVSGLCRFGEHCPEVQNRFLPEPVTHNQTGVILVTVNNPGVCACKSTLAQGTRVGGLEGGLVAKERLLVFGQLAGQHDSTKLFKEKRNSDFAKSVLSRTP